MEKGNKPSWWLLYLTVPLMIGALLVESQLDASVEVHRVMEFGIVVVGFGLMWLWVHANESALVYQEYEKQQWRIEGDVFEEPDLDPNHLPLADTVDEPEPEQYDLETSVHRGRHN